VKVCVMPVTVFCIDVNVDLHIWWKRKKLTHEKSSKGLISLDKTCSLLAEEIDRLKFEYICRRNVRSICWCCRASKIDRLYFTSMIDKINYPIIFSAT
jgi:hypothetical protein